MERVKSIIPDKIKLMIADSNANDLQSTSSSLLQFLMDLPLFQQMIKDLVDSEASLCCKNKDAAFKLKLQGNNSYNNGDFTNSLKCYSQALRVAPTDSFDADKNLVATLYLNRASLFNKLGLQLECVRDCNRALEISPSYAKAWYRRGKANAALHNYKCAIFDLNVAKHMELSVSGKKQIENELKIIEDQYNTCSPSQLAHHSENSMESFHDSSQIKLSCVTTLDKGRGMAPESDIPQGALVHMEKPYALVILKSCRETHCHYCLNELPADTVPCTSCSIPLYCSQLCQVQAGGRTISYCKTQNVMDENLPDDVKEHISVVTSCSYSDLDAENFPEHKHECLGVHWPAILPTDTVLAGRIIGKSMWRGGFKQSNFLGTLDLSHSYSRIHPEEKLELHIYAMVLLYCLQHSFGFELPINGFCLSQIIILLSQIRVNAMAVVQMKSNDVHFLPDSMLKFSHSNDSLTSSVEQVPVGQAIYMDGSLYNHSCKPNIHAYFLSRTLCIRTTEFVAKGCPLELSYGPQIGQSDCKDRIKFLEDKYLFRCQCKGCSEVNVSDLVLNAYHCVNLNCNGVVLDSCVTKIEITKLKSFIREPKQQNVDSSLQVDELTHVASKLRTSSLRSHPGCCLNCGTYSDLEALCESKETAWNFFERFQDAIISKEVSTIVLSDASRTLRVLMSILHAYNRHIAEAEDSLAQAFCLVGNFQYAGDHCKASIKILEILYGRNHIVIGYELVKLATIQLSSGDSNAVGTINRLVEIFQRYFGSHAYFIFPYLQTLREKLPV